MKMHTCTASTPRRSIFNLFLTDSQAFLYVTRRFRRVGPTEWCFSICANARSKAKQDMWVEAESCLLCRKRQQSTACGPGHHLMRVQFQIYQEKKPYLPPSCSNREERQGRQRDVYKSRGNLNCSSALLSDVSNQKLKKKKKQKTFGNAVNPSAMKDMWRVLPKSSRIYYTELRCLRNEG